MNLQELITRLQDILATDPDQAKKEVYFAVNFRNMYFYDPIVAVYREHDGIVLDANTDMLLEKPHKELDE